MHLGFVIKRHQLQKQLVNTDHKKTQYFENSRKTVSKMPFRLCISKRSFLAKQFSFRLCTSKVLLAYKTQPLVHRSPFCARCPFADLLLLPSPFKSFFNTSTSSLVCVRVFAVTSQDAIPRPDLVVTSPRYDTLALCHRSTVCIAGLCSRSSDGPSCFKRHLANRAKLRSEQSRV